MIFADDDAKIFHFCGFKLAFLQLEIQIIVGKDAEHIIDYSTM